MTRVRFAVSPTGSLLVPGARAALSNHLFAHRANGHLTLRLDDLDTERAIHADLIIQDLTWFGMEYRDTIRQSQRLDLYQTAIDRLQRDGFLYPCFESPEELKAKQEFRRKRGQSPIYDRAMLKLTPKQRLDAEAGGKRPHWRFKLSGRRIEWRDMIQGPRSLTLSAVSDPILVHADASPSPLLASVVDDIDLRTTHIIRAEDSPANTAIQIELFETLTGRTMAVPMAHVPEANGRALNLRSLRNDGIEPTALAACLSGKPNREPLALPDLAASFRLSDLANPSFDPAGLLATNRKALATLDFAAVAARLPPGATETFWLAIRGHLDLLKEARGWWDVVAGQIIPPVIDDQRDVLRTAESVLPPEPWDSTVWPTWIGALESTTGQTIGALLTPLRLALTGEDTGPDLAALLPLIGRVRAAQRLATAAA